jgi:single-strand DNA-binding protein
LKGDFIMASVNKVFMIGNVTRSIELTYLPSQTAVANFGLATNRRWKDAGGQQREEVCFIDCQAFAKGAEVIKKYVSKGDPLYVQGRLKFNTWEKDGVRHSKHILIIEAFQFISTKKKTDNSAAGEPAIDEVNQTDIPTGDDIPF